MNSIDRTEYTNFYPFRKQKTTLRKQNLTLICILKLQSHMSGTLTKADSHPGNLYNKLTNFIFKIEVRKENEVLK